MEPCNARKMLVSMISFVRWIKELPYHYESTLLRIIPHYHIDGGI